MTCCSAMNDTRRQQQTIPTCNPVIKEETIFGAHSQTVFPVSMLNVHIIDIDSFSSSCHCLQCEEHAYIHDSKKQGFVIDIRSRHDEASIHCMTQAQPPFCLGVHPTCSVSMINSGPGSPLDPPLIQTIRKQ